MKITCIIVEDIQIAADFLRKFCEKSDLVEVKGHFLNVADALEFLDEEKVDLIFLDVEMPGLSGVEVLKTIRRSHSSARQMEGSAMSAVPVMRSSRRPLRTFSAKHALMFSEAS